MAHAVAVAVSFGLGDSKGTARFLAARSRHETDDVLWARAWYGNIGTDRDDNEPGCADGWGRDSGAGGDGSGGGGDGGGDGGGGGE